MRDFELTRSKTSEHATPIYRLYKYSQCEHPKYYLPTNKTAFAYDIATVPVRMYFFMIKMRVGLTGFLSLASGLFQ